MIRKYLTAIYKDGGRGELAPDGRLLLDCWGLARAARVELYGRKLLASRGGEYQHDPEGFTERYKEQIAEMTELVEPVPGCVIAVLRKKKICTHVALCVHDINCTGLGLHVLEINPGKGVRLWPLYDFLKSCSMRTVRYYDD